MEIKKIKLSPKRGGNGYLSSYTVSIGCQEAEDCLFLNENNVLIKIVDAENGQIIIKPKKPTLTQEIVKTIIDLAERRAHLELQMMENTQEYQRVGESKGTYIISFADSLDLISSSSKNEYMQQLEESEKNLEDYLLSLQLETVTDVMTLMYMGRNKDANMELQPLDRFVDYWSDLANSNCFAGEKEVIVDQIVEKTPLADYLKSGLAILQKFASTPQEKMSLDEISEGFAAED